MNNRVVFIVVALLSVLCCCADVKYFWHLSDTHVQLQYRVGSDTNHRCVRGEGDAGPFGDYKCRPPRDVEKSAIAAMPENPPDREHKKDQLPLFVIWTGDSASFYDGKRDEVAVKKNLWALTQDLVDLRKKFGNKVPILPVLGNHDSVPFGSSQVTGDKIYNHVAWLWGRKFQMLPRDAAASLNKSGYYSVKVPDGKRNLRVIVLNTMLFWPQNLALQGKVIKDPGGQLAWFKKTLENAKKNHEPVFIAGHIPPASYYRNYSTPFIDAMENYQDIIKGSFWGHYHIDSFRIIGKNLTNAHVGHLCGSICPLGSGNPSMRRYRVDASNNYELLSWRTYVLDLPKSNKYKKPYWITLYDTVHQYGLKAITPESVKNLIERMEHDNKLLRSVRSYENYGMVPLNGACDVIKNATCRKEYFCNLRYSYPAMHRLCMQGKIKNSL